jgi:glycosyltransferase involved in cell wall biosynthesis
MSSARQLLGLLRDRDLIGPLVRRRLRRWRRRERPLPVLRDVNRVRGSASRAALLEYLPEAFLLSSDDGLFASHQNLLRCRRMAAVLGELGYVVDVTGKRDLEFWPRRDYDLVVSERLDWRGIDRLFRPDAVRVFLATALCHSAHNRNSERRHAQLAARGRPLVARRRVFGERMPAVVAADAIAAVGNAFTAGSWREVFDGPIHPFDTFAFPGTLSAEAGRDSERARRRFLFFAGVTPVQKGLDLLLEIFPRHPELELFVCTDLERAPEFCASYRRELFETANVHPIGWVAVHEERFSELARACAVIVHPSCSEGQSGAVVQCMAAGLVPLVTRETGVDLDGFGAELADDRVETLEGAILELAAKPVEWHRREGRRARDAALERYTLEAFEARWREIVHEVTAAGRRTRRKL